MDNMDLEVLREAQAWMAQGHRVVLGTVVRTWGSAPRPVGALLALRDDGRLAGSVSGGCIEDDLVLRMREGRLAARGPERLRYGVSGEEAARFGLPCGGTVALVMEPLGPQSALDELLARLATGERMQRRLSLADGRVQLQALAGEAPDGTWLDETAEDGRGSLVSTHGPSWRLLIIGAGQLGRYLAEMAVALGYAVSVCDPREEHAGGWPVANAPLVPGMPDDVVLAMKPDAHTAIVALTHDPKLDDLALMEALASPAFYVGALGSALNQRKRQARLAEHFGLSAAQLARLHGPIGLRLGARTPPEIAVAILAEMTAVRYGAELPAGLQGRDALRLGQGLPTACQGLDA